MNTQDEQRIREIVREELKAVLEKTANELIDRLNSELAYDNAKGLYK